MWAQLGLNQRPPDYEFQIGISSGLHRFVCVCTRLSYSTLYVKDYTYLYDFVEILAPKLAPSYYVLRLVRSVFIIEVPYFHAILAKIF